MLHTSRFFTYGTHMGYPVFGGVWSWLIGLGVVLLVGVVVYLFVKALKKSSAGDDALEALKLKYVKGEIDEEEYLKRKSVLRGR